MIIPQFRVNSQVVPWESKTDEYVGESTAEDYFEKNRVEEGDALDNRYPLKTDFHAHTSYNTDPFSMDPFATDNYPHSDAEESESMASSTLASEAGLRVVDKIDITGAWDDG